MIVNRSVPRATVIPVLTYDDVRKASDWLCGAFGFTERLSIGNHRIQLVYGDGAVILTGAQRQPGDQPGRFVHIHVRVDDRTGAAPRSTSNSTSVGGVDSRPATRGTLRQRHRPTPLR